MKSNLLTILFGGLIVGLPVLAFLKGGAPSIKKPEYAIGTIVDFEYGRRYYALVAFSVEDEIHMASAGPSAHKANIIGEKYKVVYEKGDPSKNIVLLQEPIFLKGEQVIKTKGVIKRIYKFNWSSNDYLSNHGLEFKYVVGDETFKKAQSLPRDYKARYPDLKEGDTCNIAYWTSNCERAIIYLENDSTFDASSLEL